MKWFGKKEQPPALPMARGFGAWGDAGAPQSYASLLKDGFERNPVAQRAVRMVAEAAGAAPVVASEPQVAAMLARRTQGQALIETVAAQLLLHGNAYLTVECDADGQAIDLYALRPERVTIAVDANGWPAAYLYRVGERVVRYSAEDAWGRRRVIHLRALNPGDDLYGAGCLGAAAGAIAIHNAATRWNRALLDNAARPSGALVMEGADASLSEAQFARLRGDLDNAFSGAGNAGRPLLLEGGLKWQPLSLTPADMDFVGLKAAAAREIALAFGVPPMLLGLPGDATYANYREASRALWRLTVLPLMGAVLAGVRDGLSGHWPDLTLKVAAERIAALAEDRERLWGAVAAADFLTRKEKRELIGLEGDAQ